MLTDIKILDHTVSFTFSRGSFAQLKVNTERFLFQITSMALRCKRIKVEPADALTLESISEGLPECGDSLPLQLQKKEPLFHNLHSIPEETGSKGLSKSSGSSVKDELELQFINQIQRAFHSLRVLVIVFVAISVVSLSLNIWVITSVLGRGQSDHDYRVDTPQQGIEKAFSESFHYRYRSSYSRLRHETL